MKALREENGELKEEVDRLEGAYEDIMKEFGKMQSLHAEITQMADEAGIKEVVVRLEGIDEDTSLEELNDRELAKIDRRIKNYAARVKEERDRRRPFVRGNAPGYTSNDKGSKASNEDLPQSVPTSAQQFVSVNDCWQGSTMQLDRFNSRPSEQTLTGATKVMFDATLSPDEEGVALRHPR